MMLWIAQSFAYLVTGLVLPFLWNLVAQVSSLLVYTVVPCLWNLGAQVSSLLVYTVVPCLWNLGVSSCALLWNWPKTSLCLVCLVVCVVGFDEDNQRGRKSGVQERRPASRRRDARVARERETAAAERHQQVVDRLDRERQEAKRLDQLNRERAERRRQDTRRRQEEHRQSAEDEQHKADARQREKDTRRSEAFVAQKRRPVIIVEVPQTTCHIFPGDHRPQHRPPEGFALPDPHGWQGSTVASWVLGGNQEDVSMPTQRNPTWADVRRERPR